MLHIGRCTLAATMEFLSNKPLLITDTILRDAHQSQAATRMTTADMLPALEMLDSIGYYSLECWGGATFDACMRFLNEDRACAFGTGQIGFFSLENQTSPALSAHIKLEEEIKSVCYSDKYVGVVVENPEGESDYRLDVYSAGGKLKFSQPVSFQYKEIDIDGDMVILYNENSCEIYNMSGKCRFSGSFDFFTRRSKDLLYSRPIAPSLGYGSIDENVGALKNTGIEMVLNGTIINQNGWVWKLGMNLTHYKNKVTDLPLKDMPRSGVNKLQVGRSVYDFYMIEWAGVDPENGDPLWYKNEVDANKNPTGKRVTTNDYGSADYYYVNKSSLPKVYGGFNTSLSWKGFDLSAIFAYSIGGYIYNRDVTMILHNGSLEGRDWSTEILRRWTPDNRYTDVPALSTTSNNWNSASTRFLQNNSYMRLKNLTLSYNLPKQWISKLSLSSVQVYVQGDNLFTIHRNQGLDPEQGITGITYYRYPAMRTISGGINVSF